MIDIDAALNLLERDNESEMMTGVGHNAVEINQITIHAGDSGDTSHFKTVTLTLTMKTVTLTPRYIVLTLSMRSVRLQLYRHKLSTLKPYLIAVLPVFFLNTMQYQSLAIFSSVRLCRSFLCKLVKFNIFEQAKFR